MYIQELLSKKNLHAVYNFNNILTTTAGKN